MSTATLTLNLPAEEIEFLNGYARQHGLTVAEVVGRYAQRLKGATEPVIHPDVAAVTGLVPADIDVKIDYHRHLLDKHR